MKTIYGKILYEGQWVKVMNKQWNRFYAGCLPCSVCGGQKVESIWFNFVTTEVRCKRCFTPAGAVPFVARPKKEPKPRKITNELIRSAVLAVVLKQRHYPEGVGSFRVASRMRMETADARVVLEKATALGLLTEPTPGYYLLSTTDKRELVAKLDAALPPQHRPRLGKRSTRRRGPTTEAAE